MFQSDGGGGGPQAAGVLPRIFRYSIHWNNKIVADKNKYFDFVSKNLKSYVPTKLNGEIELEVEWPRQNFPLQYQYNIK